MKILWVKTDFLHPTTRGGQIRTLEMLRELHKRHEIHYVAFNDPQNPEGLARSSEYATKAYPVEHRAVSKRSPEFALQLLAGLFDKYPVSGTRFRSGNMRKQIAHLITTQNFDAKICDFLAPSINIDELLSNSSATRFARAWQGHWSYFPVLTKDRSAAGPTNWVLFQHNVETMIWERRAQAGRTPLHRAYFRMQAQRMFAWEKAACNAALRVIAVSRVDEQIMRERFGVRNISAVGTGVDLDYFAPPGSKTLQFDFVFVGSMDWVPNIDGIEWFLAEVFPRIKASKPDARLAIVGRSPVPSITAKADQKKIFVTGTVPDVRPFLWQSAIVIVPLRVGGGTRLKIFEAMAAGVPVIATAIGAEGLPVKHGSTIEIADTAQDFAAACLRLVANRREREQMAQAALDLVRANFSWARVTRDFEDVLQAAEPANVRTA